MEILDWISEWMISECDGDWEHEYGIKIETLDNPGWDVEIDLSYTDLENLHFEYTLVENSEHDWYCWKVKNGKFEAAGDLKKLPFLLNKFKELVEEYSVEDDDEEE